MPTFYYKLVFLGNIDIWWNSKYQEKILLIGGGIANFTDVAKTFKGIVRALIEFAERLRDNNVRIYVRRGGPNYQEGLRIMEDLGKETHIPIEVYGPDTHMTRIVPLALKREENCIIEKLK